MAAILNLLLLLLMGLTCCWADSAHDDMSDLLPGDYCKGRTGHHVRNEISRDDQKCCAHRDDRCSVPLLGTLCYCDVFCNRTTSSDCCPDFWEYCMGITPPEPNIRPHCFHAGERFVMGQTFKSNCNQCTCRQTESFKYDFMCERKVCLVRPELVRNINDQQLGWKASNYSMFWGKTLEEGKRLRLGTYRPTRPTMNMNELHLSSVSLLSLPESFDSRQKWPGLVENVMDQGDCASSWAVSTTSVASDRLAIQSGGLDRTRLSPQHLISCQNRRQRGCEGGHLDRAWWFLRKKGVASEECVPYVSGQTGQSGSCSSAQRRLYGDAQVTCAIGARREKVHFSTPPYRVAPKEDHIMQEIMSNGPVQATFKVNDDFFLYQYGVYRTTPSYDNVYSTSANDDANNGTAQEYHSVRIIGWGVDRSAGRPVKYWLCANSWGRLWGEEGHFRIARGQNECDIEMFVVGVWGRKEEQDDFSANLIRPPKISARFVPNN